MSDLTALAQMACSYPDLLASAITAYQEQHHLDDQQMIQYLKVADLYHFHLLCLCHRPEIDDSSEDSDDFKRIMEYTVYLGVDPQALLRVVKGTPRHLEWQEDRRTSTWTCTLTPYQAVMSKTTPTTVTAYVDSPTGRHWGTHKFQSFIHARDWCERKLDELATSQQ